MNKIVEQLANCVEGKGLGQLCRKLGIPYTNSRKPLGVYVNEADRERLIEEQYRRGRNELIVRPVKTNRLNYRFPDIECRRKVLHNAAHKVLGGRILPKFLYHGTSLKNRDPILERGIQPRGHTASNWPNEPSRSDCVYLTTNQAFGYGRSLGNYDRFVVFEVDVQKLDTKRFYPDEDFVADFLATRGSLGQSYHELLPQVLSMIEDFKPFWIDSLYFMGGLAHLSAIPSNALTRYCEVDLSQLPCVDICQPADSLFMYGANWEQCDQDTQWFFGDRPDFYQLRSALECRARSTDTSDFERLDRIVARWRKESENRAGIVVKSLL